MALCFSKEFINLLRRDRQRYAELVPELQRIYLDLSHAAIFSESKSDVLRGQAQGVYELMEAFQLETAPPVERGSGFFA